MTSNQSYKFAFIAHALASGMVFVGLVQAAPAAEIYIQTEVDSNGRLHILTKRHREIVPKKDPEQLGFGKVEIAPDGRSVGWLALYPDPTSYAVPLKLVVYASDNAHSFRGSGLPIRRWCFQAEGRQVAFEQETVHGGTGVHYELRDIATGQLIAQYEPDSSSEMTPKPPRWVAEVDSKP